MIYYTGDIHGDASGIKRFCKRMRPTTTDTIVLLGDVGVNYSLGEGDRAQKQILGRLAPTFLCLHGNHEMRPQNIDTYKPCEWNGGTVWKEEEFPNILFAKDGEIYTIEGIDHIAIGGAYSVDKYYRLMRGYHWWQDEQPSEEIKRFVEKQVREKQIDIVLSHTCPFKYEPIEMFLPMIDQSTVDDSTEHWLDSIEELLEYKAWFCGHWHVDKRVDKMHFLFHGFESSEQFRCMGDDSDEGFVVSGTSDSSLSSAFICTSGFGKSKAESYSLRKSHASAMPNPSSSSDR